MSLCDVKNIDQDVQRRLEDYLFSSSSIIFTLKRFRGDLISVRFSSVQGVVYECLYKKKLGAGAVGQVYLFADSVSRVAFAIKESEDAHEIPMASKLVGSGCNVLRTRYIGGAEDEYWQQPENKGKKRLHVFLMELADGDLGNLLEKKVRMSPADALQLVEQLRQQMLCLYEVSNRQYVYCDIKVGNIFYKCHSDLTHFRVFLGDLEGAVPIHKQKDRIYFYNNTFVPEEGTFVGEADMNTPEGSLQKKALLSFSVGIALLSLAMFFINPNKVMKYLDQYYPPIIPELKKKKMLMTTSAIQQFLNKLYGNNKLGRYLSDDYKKRPDIRTPLTTLENPIQPYVDVNSFEEFNVEQVLSDIQHTATLLQATAQDMKRYAEQNNADKVERLYEEAQVLEKHFLQQAKAMRQVNTKLITPNQKRHLEEHTLQHLNAVQLARNIVQSERAKHLSTKGVTKPVLQEFPEEQKAAEVSAPQKKKKAAPAPKELPNPTIFDTTDPATFTDILKYFQKTHVDVKTNLVDFVQNPPTVLNAQALKLVLDHFIMLKSNPRIAFLRQPLTFVLFHEPVGGLLLIQDVNVNVQAQANPYSNVVLLAQSWESLTRQVTLLQQEIDLFLGPHMHEMDEYCQHYSTTTYLFYMKLCRMIEKLPLKTKQLIEEERENVSNIQLDERVITLQHYYFVLQKALFQCKVLLYTCRVLTGLEKKYGNVFKFKWYTECVAEKMGNLDFIQKIHVLDQYVLQYSQWLLTNEPVSCSSLKETLQSQTFSFIANEKDHTLRYMRCSHIVQDLILKLRGTQKHYSATQLLSGIKNLSRQNKNVGIDFSDYIQKGEEHVTELKNRALFNKMQF